MNIISGTPAIQITERPGDQSLQLRVNQRVTADILKVSGDQVTLAIQGTRVVGRITGNNQTVSLTDQKTAQFIVRGMSDGVLQLQLAGAESGQALQATSPQWTVLAMNLLRLNGMSINDLNLMLGKALLNAGLPVTADLINSLQQALEGVKNWGQPEADLAAAFISNGLPLSSGTLNLTLQELPSLAETALKLQDMLAAYTKSSSNGLSGLANEVLNMLKNGVVDWSSTTQNLTQQLNRAVSLWGKSVESQIADLLTQGKEVPANPDASNGLLSLAILRRGLSQQGNQALVNQIDHFMDAIRQMQFLNTSRSQDPTNPPWLTMNLPVKAGWEGRENETQANLKIAYRHNGKSDAIDPFNTRLVLSIDLGEGELLEADLSMVGKRIGAWLTVSNQDWKSLVEEELPSLQEGLQEVGYQLQFARCEVKQHATIIQDEPMNKKIDLEA